MKSKPTVGALVAITLAAGLIGGCATSTEVMQKWSYNQLVIAGPQDAGGGTVSMNTLTLERPSPTSTRGRMKFTGAITDRCVAGWADTTIEYTPTSIILQPKNLFANCTDFRITIRNDGSGGTVERRAYKSAQWNPYAIEPGLIPR